MSGQHWVGVLEKKGLDRERSTPRHYTTPYYYHFLTFATNGILVNTYNDNHLQRLFLVFYACVAYCLYYLGMQALRQKVYDLGLGKTNRHEVIDNIRVYRTNCES